MGSKQAHPSTEDAMPSFWDRMYRSDPDNRLAERIKTMDALKPQPSTDPEEADAHFAPLAVAPTSADLEAEYRAYLASRPADDAAEEARLYQQPQGDMR